MRYDEAVSWLNASQQHGMKLGLHRIEYLLDLLDHPEKDLNVIHVAGTNGKGSVCRYISSILAEEGYQVGLFTSPHLESIRERFCINNKMISKKDFSFFITKIKTVLDKSKQEQLQPTYFEICTALVFLYFQRNNVDYAVVEVGLGGRYDATNVVTPLLSVITNISLDHQHVLGETIKEIAYEKAGIIKEDTPVITAAEGTALESIKQVSDSMNAPLIVVKKDACYIQEIEISYQSVIIQGILDRYQLDTQEIGMYQRQNLCIAVYAIEQLQLNGVYVSADAIQQGVWCMSHPGRMKLMHQKPMLFIDGAHNIGGIIELKKTVETLFPDQNIILLFGVLQDKNGAEMIKMIQPVVKTIVLTQSSNNRADDPVNLYSTASLLFNESDVYVTNSVEQGIKKCLEIASLDDIIIVTGSLYTVKDALSVLRKS